MLLNVVYVHTILDLRSIASKKEINDKVVELARVEELFKTDLVKKIEEKIALCHVFKLELKTYWAILGHFGGGAWKILLYIWEGGMPPYKHQVSELGARTQKGGQN